MNKPKIYIDGQAGTTGLEIVKRLSNREDIELLKIPDDKRHDDVVRKEYMKEADLVFLCLPDAASIEAMKLIDEKTKVIDASTAHRTDPDWVYGFPELSNQQKQKIKSSYRVANPGCHATGFISIVYPLMKHQFIQKDTLLSCTSLTGYSGGGKSMIAQYETKKTSDLYAPRLYGLSLQHKHLKEMKQICHLEKTPLFCPVVDDYYRGMLTTIMIEGNKEEIVQLYQDLYQDTFIEVTKDEDTYLSANLYAQKDNLKICIHGNDQQVMISALFDNLGKGASGAAIQNMNLMLGFEEYKGLSY